MATGFLRWCAATAMVKSKFSRNIQACLMTRRSARRLLTPCAVKFCPIAIKKPSLHQKQWAIQFSSLKVNFAVISYGRLVYHLSHSWAVANNTVPMGTIPSSSATNVSSCVQTEMSQVWPSCERLQQTTPERSGFMQILNRLSGTRCRRTTATT